ncbi:fibronectin type III domain-containing protein [Anaerocolumna xylanovorans]|uniref:Fibronectin type III domain-containing protein n=1 Tax=Anaerocolumna xylanovorans DSM 12503 TaxID=1121345 RepID=A0A1M7YF38_9FIRM|nr:fibronectin type III domain-containing protein [Anaerocolumna xylanovorans]SHO51189.1 Fibronectin type III domain-containing protein [Anaerocolumna xylanovorans DSM 12503]
MRSYRILKKSLGMLLIVILFVVQIFSSSVIVQADTGYDKTAPILNGLTISNADNIDTEKGMKITFDLKEDGVGVNNIIIYFKGQESGKIRVLQYFASPDEGINPLYSGKTTVTLSFNEKFFYEEMYFLEDIYLSDANGNISEYSVQKGAECLKNSTSKIIVTHSTTTDFTEPKLNNMTIENADNIDSSTGLININVDTIDDGSGINDITLSFRNEKNALFYVHWQVYSIYPDGNELHTGKYNLIAMIQDPLVVGSYTLERVTLSDHGGNYTEYTPDSPEWSKFTQKITVTKSNYEVSTTPTIKSINLDNTTIVTPDCLEVPITITTGKYGVSCVFIILINEEGGNVFLSWYSDTPIMSGTYRLKFPIDPFQGEGKYKIDYIQVSPAVGSDVAYDRKDLKKVSGFIDPTITINSAFDITYNGATGNVDAAVLAINSMNEGQTAVLDFRNNNKADKRLFQAIAGKDKTVVFENNDVQWIFNGKDINPDNCKTINLNVNISKKRGSDYGCANDDYILRMQYAENGVLPGKVQMRISNEFLKEKYKVTSDMILSYYDQAPDVLDTDVECAGDGYTEYEISHNSTYILSANMPVLNFPQLVKANCVKYSYIKLNWNRVAGANGYYIYRSSSKTGGYKKVGTVTNASQLTWSDKSISIGKTYYYKIQARGAKNNIKAKYSAVISCTNAPSVTKGLKLSSKSKTSLKLTWAKQTGVTGYKIYQYKNSKWIEIKTIKNYYTTSSTMKGLASGTTYKFKIRAYKTSNKKIAYGAYSKVITVSTK